MKIPTVKIAFGNGFVIINQQDFTPGKHTIYEEPRPAPKAPDAPQLDPLPITRDGREAELMEMSWQAIKKIAESHGIEKPEDGWDEAIPMILDAEFPQE